MGEVERIDTGEDSRICLRGEIDLSNVEVLRREIDRLLAEISSERVLVDLSDVQYIDSQGVALLLELSRQLSRRNVHLRLVAPYDSVASEVLSISAVSELPVDRSID